MLDKQDRSSIGSKQSWIDGRRASIQLYHIQPKHQNPNQVLKVSWKASLFSLVVVVGLGMSNYFLRSHYTMWFYVLPCFCLLVSIPWLTKVYAQQKVNESLRITLEQYRSIANSYTENGTPYELQAMIENLEEVMEELKFLEKCD